MSNKSSSDDTIGAICFAFDGQDPASAGEISKEQVHHWMRSDDLNVRGCVYSMIAELERAKNIKPPVEFEDYYSVVVPYLMQCIE